MSFLLHRAPTPLAAAAAPRRRRSIAVAAAASAPPPRRPPPNPAPPRPKRGRREPPAPLLDLSEDDEDENDYDEDEDDATTTTSVALLRRRRRARLDAAYRRVVSEPSFARDGDVRLYFKKRRLLAERAELEDNDDRRRRRRGDATLRSWVDDNDALPRPETARKLSQEARAQVTGERAGSLARALGWGEDDEDHDEDGPSQEDTSLPRLASRLLSRHPGLLARATSELAAAARGHARASRLPVDQVLRLAIEAPRLLLAHPDAAEARAGLLGRALVVGGGGSGSGGKSGKSNSNNSRTPAAALLWRYPSALGTARARPLIEWAEALAAAVAAAAAAVRGPRAGAPAAGVAESLAVLAAGVELMEEQRVDDQDEDTDAKSEGFSRDAWLQRADPEVAAAAVAALATHLKPPTSLPLFPLLRAEPALLLRSGDELRQEAWRRLEAALEALERLFLEEEEDPSSAAATAAASRAVLLAPGLLRAISKGDDDAGTALKDALRDLSSTEWLFGGGEEGGERALSAARQHPRLLLAALERQLDARANGLARALGVPVEEVRLASKRDLSLLAAPPALVQRALLRLARGLLVGGGGGDGDDDSNDAAAAALASRLWSALAAENAAAAYAGSWAAAERGWLPLQLRALCACLRLPAAEVRRVLLSSLPTPAAEQHQPPPPSPPALAALAAPPSELRQGHARLTAALRRLAERRRRSRRQQQPALAAEARLAAALLRGAPALAVAALSPGLNAAAIAALDALGVDATDDEAVQAVRRAVGVVSV